MISVYLHTGKPIRTTQVMTAISSHNKALLDKKKTIKLHEYPDQTIISFTKDEPASDHWFVKAFRANQDKGVLQTSWQPDPSSMDSLTRDAVNALVEDGSSGEEGLPAPRGKRRGSRTSSAQARSKASKTQGAHSDDWVRELETRLETERAQFRTMSEVWNKDRGEWKARESKLEADVERYRDNERSFLNTVLNSSKDHDHWKREKEEMQTEWKADKAEWKAALEGKDQALLAKDEIIKKKEDKCDALDAECKEKIKSIEAQFDTKLNAALTLKDMEHASAIQKIEGESKLAMEKVLGDNQVTMLTLKNEGATKLAKKHSEHLAEIVNIKKEHVDNMHKALGDVVNISSVIKSLDQHVVYTKKDLEKLGVNLKKRYIQIMQHDPEYGLKHYDSGIFPGYIYYKIMLPWIEEEVKKHFKL